MRKRRYEYVVFRIERNYNHTDSDVAISKFVNLLSDFGFELRSFALGGDQWDWSDNIAPTIAGRFDLRAFKSRKKRLEETHKLKFEEPRDLMVFLEKKTLKPAPVKVEGDYGIHYLEKTERNRARPYYDLEDEDFLYVG